jgi:hypothetical protein
LHAKGCPCGRAFIVLAEVQSECFQIIWGSNELRASLLCYRMAWMIDCQLQQLEKTLAYRRGETAFDESMDFSPNNARVKHIVE